MADYEENENTEQEVDTTGAPDLEERAREMGWMPKEEYKGNPDNWRSAEDFVEKGKHLLPLISANNKKLRQELLTRDKDIATLKQAVETSQKAIKALQKTYTESTKLQVEQARKELRDQLKAAKEIGDVDAELLLIDKLDDLKQAVKEQKDEDTSATEVTTLDPAFVQWQSENPWFGNTTDAKDNSRTQALVKVGEELRSSGDRSTGRTFMDKCVRELERQEAGAKKILSKVEGSSGAGHRSSGSGGFLSLPKEAQDACHEDTRSFVGPGKMFKTVKEWENHFYSLYQE